MTQKDIDKAIEAANSDPATYKSEGDLNGSTKAERILAEAYYEQRAENRRLRERGDKLAKEALSVVNTQTPRNHLIALSYLKEAIDDYEAEK